MPKMDESEEAFQKRSHRPWKPNLLETPEQTVDLTLETTDTATEQNNASFLDPTSILTPSPNNPNPSKGDIQTIRQDIEKTIQARAQERENLLNQINDKGKSKILIGGFFQPSSRIFQGTETKDNQVSKLLNDLKAKEHELNTLTHSLQASEALAQADQATLEREISEKARLAAEEKVKTALMQAQQARQQLQATLEKTKESEVLINEYSQKIDLLEAQLQNNQDALAQSQRKQALFESEKSSLEKKIQHTLEECAELEMSKQALQEQNDALNSKLQEVVVQLNTQQTENKALKKQNLSDQELLKQAQSQIVELTHFCEQLQEQTKAVQTQEAAITAQLAQTTQLLEQEKQEGLEACERLKAAFNQIETLKLENQQITDSIEKHKDQVLKTQQETHRLNGLLKMQENTLKNLESNESGLNAQLEEVLEKNRTLEDNVQTLSEKKNELHLTLKKQQTESDEIKQAFLTQKQQFEALTTQTEAKTQAEVEKATQTLQSELNKQQVEKKQLQEQLLGSKNQLQKLSEVIESEQSLRKLAQQKVEEIQKAKIQAETQRNNATERMISLEQRLQESENLKKQAEIKAQKAVKQAKQALMSFLEDDSEQSL